MAEQTIIGLKDLRENLAIYLAEIGKGKSFTVVRRSKPIFNITPVKTEDRWEEALDFTKIKKGGVDIDEILERL